MPKELFSTALFIEEEWKSLYFSIALLSAGQGEAATVRYVGIKPLAMATNLTIGRVSTILANLKVKGLIDAVHIERGVGSIYIVRVADDSLELRPIDEFVKSLTPAKEVVEREQKAYRSMGRYAYIEQANTEIANILKVDTLRYFLK